MFMIGLNYRKEGETYQFDDQPIISSILLIDVKTPVRPSACGLAFTWPYMFIASTLHDGFLLKLNGLENLPSVSGFDTIIDDIAITSKKKKQIKEKPIELVAEKVDNIVNLMVVNAVFDNAS
jgi:hypothetical protein